MQLIPTITPAFGGFLIISWSIAVIIFFVWRKTQKPLLIYGHLAFLFLPLFIFAQTLSCSWDWIASLAQFCSIMWTKLLIYLIPFAVGGAIIVGYFIIPLLYRWHLKAQEYPCHFIEKYTREQGINMIRFYIIDTMKPVAFSFSTAIFMSIGMYELLTRKQREAVLLHELYHIKEQSGWKKFSSLLGRMITPLAHFSHVHRSIEAEEEAADTFAINIQGTNKNLLTAQQKVMRYEYELLKYTT